jgi:ATP adenylyltransferase
MSQTKLILKPGTLAEKVTQRTTHALQCGALQPIPTDYQFVEDGNIRFMVRISSNLARKDKAKKQEKKDKNFNPFLPYEEDLFVANISEFHLCLLNKYNVIDNHLLIVTREFEEQENLLNLADFQAMWACLAEIDGLVFYNSGKTAGASQRHKHLQLVPLPLVPEGESIPIEAAIAAAEFEGDVGTMPDFPFLHAIAKLDPSLPSTETAEATLESYLNLLRMTGVKEKDDAYNLLATREWMLLVPRSREDFDSISVNSLGFAGALFVRNEDRLNALKQHGPLTVLTNVARLR